MSTIQAYARSPYPLLSPSILNHYPSNYLVSLAHVLITHDPFCYSQASKSREWIDAMDNEIAALELSDTWVLTILPPNKKAIVSKWVYKIKYKLNESVK